MIHGVLRWTLRSKGLYSKARNTPNMIQESECDRKKYLGRVNWEWDAKHGGVKLGCIEGDARLSILCCICVWTCICKCIFVFVSASVSVSVFVSVFSTQVTQKNMFEGSIESGIPNTGSSRGRVGVHWGTRGFSAGSGEASKSHRCLATYSQLGADRPNALSLFFDAVHFNAMPTHA